MMTDSEATRQAFESVGAIRRGHFVVPAGHHTGEFWEKFALLQSPALASSIIGLLAKRLCGYGATHVAGPSQGGLVMSFELGRQMGLPAVFVEKSPKPERFIVQRGTILSDSDRVIVVDDLVSSGHTLAQVIDTVRLAGAQVVAAAVMIDRRATVANPAYIAVPVEALLQLDGPPSWDPSLCPLCAVGKPLFDPRSLVALKDGV